MPVVVVAGVLLPLVLAGDEPDVGGVAGDPSVVPEPPPDSALPLRSVIV
ncbi:MAG: hypothetical protein AAF799_15135 [Myxococcota bacterium]